MSGDPKTLTPGELLAIAHEHDWSAHFHDDGYVEIESLGGDDLAYEGGLLDALCAATSKVLGVPVVARDEAAELRARIAELETTNFALSEDSALVANENAELRAALREWAEATRAFEDADSAWDNAIYAGEDTGGYTAAWTRALARVKDAEANLRRLAEGEKP